MFKRGNKPDFSADAFPMVALIQTLAVAEYLNFRHAADALGVNLSSVSTRVKTLEEDLGTLLFERHARGVRLTEAGRAFVEQIAAGVDLIDHAVKTATIAAKGEHGRLGIGVHGLIPGNFLDGLLTRFRTEHPAIALEMVESSAREMIMSLRVRRIDVALLVGTFDLPDCGP
jgi:DNA-binding transcriptional LysR family regulator